MSSLCSSVNGGSCGADFFGCVTVVLVVVVVGGATGDVCCSGGGFGGAGFDFPG